MGGTPSNENPHGTHEISLALLGPRVERALLRVRCGQREHLTGLVQTELVYLIYSYMEVSINGGTPKWMVFVREKPYFRKPPHTLHHCCRLVLYMMA